MAVDGVHDFTIHGTAKYPDGTAAPKIKLDLSFSPPNKGHDYTDDPADIWPPNWTKEKPRNAKFVVKVGVNDKLVEETTVTTDANGKFDVHVLSSDIISSSTRIEVNWTDESGKEQNVGKETCYFEQAESRDPGAETENPVNKDHGWKLNPDVLIHSEEQTAATFYLRYHDAKGDWLPVNGHTLKISIGDVTLKPGKGYTKVSDTGVYAYFVHKDGTPYLDKDDHPAKYIIVTTGTSDVNNDKTIEEDEKGFATVYVNGGPLVFETETIPLKAEDETQGTT